MCNKKKKKKTKRKNGGLNTSELFYPLKYLASQRTHFLDGNSSPFSTFVYFQIRFDFEAFLFVFVCKGLHSGQNFISTPFSHNVGRRY